MKKGKKVFTAVSTAVLSGLTGFVFGFGVCWWTIPVPSEKTDVRQALMIMGPDTGGYGAYLAGFLASQNQDYDQAAAYWTTAMKQAPDVPKIKIPVYLMRLVRGDVAGALPLARDLQTLKQPELLADEVLIADALRRADYDTAARLLKDKPAYGVDNLFKPAIGAWIEVGRKNKKAALKALAPLNKEKTRAFYEYYTALVSLAFSDTKAAQKAFTRMDKQAQAGYPSLTALVFMRDFLTTQKAWKAGRAEYDHAERVLAKMPAIRETINTLHAPTVITPAIGAAIVYYDTSVALAPLKIQEASLVLNALAMYLDPDAMTPRIWAAELLEGIKNYRAANEIYDGMKNKTDLVSLKQAMNMIADENYTSALPAVEALIQRAGNDGFLLSLAAEAAYRAEDYERAVRYYRQSADALLQAGQADTAAEALLMLAHTYETADQPDQVEPTLQEAMRANPNNALVLNYLGYVWLDARKNINEAFDLVARAYAMAPNDPNIMDSMALGYYVKQDYVQALPLAERATDELPFSSVAYAHLGDIYAALGRNREARYQYRKALDLAADITPALRRELESKLKK